MKLLLHKEKNPSSLVTLTRQFTIPVYLLAWPDIILTLTSYVYNKSLTLSIGATAVLDIAAETPPAKKSIIKLSVDFFFFTGADIAIDWLKFCQNLLDNL